MTQEWETKKLDDLCQIAIGKTPYRGDKSFWDTEKKTNNVWLSIADLLNTEKNFVSDSKEYITDKAVKISKIVKKGTLLLSFKLTLGRLAFTGKDLFTNEAIAALTIKNEKILDKYFLYHFLSLFDWNSLTEGDVKVKGKTLNKAKLKEIEIRFPTSIFEQQRIVSTIDKAFAAIDKAKANTEQNLKNAKELFESYLQRVFENQNYDWNERKISEEFELKPQKKEARSILDETDYVTFLPMEDLGVLNKEVTGIKCRQFKNVSGSYTYFAENDVLMAKITPCFENGKLGIARNLINGIGFGSSEFIVFRTKGNIVSEFLYYFLSRRQIRDEGRKYMSGAVGHKRVSKDWIENYLIQFPKSVKEQNIIIKKLDTLSTETKKLEAIYHTKINKLEELKKSILQKAFAGELTH